MSVEMPNALHAIHLRILVSLLARASMPASQHHPRLLVCETLLYAPLTIQSLGQPTNC